MSPETTTIEYTDEFVSILGDLRRGRSKFVTGKAGSGKSTLIREFAETAGHDITLTATTGIAALNIDGQTVHRLFGIQKSMTVQDVIDGSYQPRGRTKVLRALRTLVIDEASMLRADLFDTILEILKRHGPHPGRWAGGVQLILVGDLYQLPPVVLDPEEEYFRSYYTSPFFFSAKNYDPEQLPTVQLTKVFRQIGDPTLTDLLNSVRDGVVTSHVRAMLAARVQENFDPPENEYWLTLTGTNDRASRINRRKLEQLPGPHYQWEAETAGELDAFDNPNDVVVHYAVGAQVMLLNNDTIGRWVNGTTGVITAVDSAGNPTIKLRDSGVRVTVEPHTWEILRTATENGSLVNKVVGAFTQMPFKLAWAITIHKSQGQTLDRMVVDLTGGTFAAGQTYVALSRATTLDGIVLTKPVAAKDLKTDSRIVRFLADRTANVDLAPRCALAISTVGDHSFSDVPRIVELAIAFDNGTGLSTIVNPDRDPGTALQDYGISNDALILAPTIAEAWMAIAPFLAGHTPVGVDIDVITQTISADLKRLDRAIVMPIGTTIITTGQTPQLRALDRAVAALHTAAQTPTDPDAQLFTDDVDELADVGYLLTRDPETPQPQWGTESARQALADSLAVSAAVDGRTAVPIRTLTGKAIGHRLQRTLLGIGRLSPTLTGQARRLQDILGMELLPPETGETSITEILIPGAAVCFTGDTEVAGKRFARKELEEIATQRGLRPVGTVTKRNCDALVTAQVGSQSRKAKDAVKFSKPILSAAEFLEWATG